MSWIRHWKVGRPLPISHLIADSALIWYDLIWFACVSTHSGSGVDPRTMVHLPDPRPILIASKLRSLFYHSVIARMKCFVTQERGMNQNAGVSKWSTLKTLIQTHLLTLCPWLPSHCWQTTWPTEPKTLMTQHFTTQVPVTPGCTPCCGSWAHSYQCPVY